MDKTKFNFSVTFSNAVGKNIGLCAEFPFLSFLALSDKDAYYGIVNLACELHQLLENSLNFSQRQDWLKKYIKNFIDDDREFISLTEHSQNLHNFSLLRDILNLSIDEYKQLTKQHRNIADSLAMPSIENIEFEPQPLTIEARAPDFS